MSWSLRSVQHTQILSSCSTAELLQTHLDGFRVGEDIFKRKQTTIKQKKSEEEEKDDEEE